MDGSYESIGKLVITGRNATNLLEVKKEVFCKLTFFVQSKNHNTPVPSIRNIILSFSSLTALYMYWSFLLKNFKTYFCDEGCLAPLISIYIVVFHVQLIPRIL